MRATQVLPWTMLSVGAFAGLIHATAPAASLTSAAVAWGPIENLSRSPNPSGDVTSVAVGRTIHVVWVETLYGAPSIYHTFRILGQDWSTPTRVDAGSRPDLAVGPDGSVHLVWLNDSRAHSGYATSFIRYRRWNAARGLWLDAANVAIGGVGTLGSPVVAGGPDGAAHVVWVDLVTDTPRLRYRYRSAAGWGEGPTNIAEGRWSDLRPQVQADLTGGVHVVWADTSLLGDRYDVYYMWAMSPHDWSVPTVLSYAQSGDSLAPSIGIDSADRLQVVWSRFNAGTASVWRRRGRETSWAAADLIVATAERTADPVVAVDERDVVHVAFVTADGIDYYSRGPSDLVWRAGVPILRGEPEAASPQLALTGPDDTHAVWTAPGTAGVTDVYYRTTASGAEATATSTATATPGVTLTPTATATGTPGVILTATATATGTAATVLTPTATYTPTASSTPSVTPTATEPTTPQRCYYYIPLIARQGGQGGAPVADAGVAQGVRETAAVRRWPLTLRSLFYSIRIRSAMPQRLFPYALLAAAAPSGRWHGTAPLQDPGA